MSTIRMTNSQKAEVFQRVAGQIGRRGAPTIARIFNVSVHEAAGLIDEYRAGGVRAPRPAASPAPVQEALGKLSTGQLGDLAGALVFGESSAGGHDPKTPATASNPAGDDREMYLAEKLASQVQSAESKPLSEASTADLSALAAAASWF